MRYDRFLDEVNRKMSAAKKSKKKQIVRFFEHSEYMKFHKLWARLKGKLDPLNKITMLPTIGGFSCPARVIAGIQRMPQSIYLEEDIRIQVYPSSFIPARPEALRPSAMPWGIRRVKAEKAWLYSKGRQVKIGVIDTGVDYMHPNLRSSVSYGVNLIHPQAFPFDDNGHGTHISGTIAATGGAYGFSGIAPQAIIYPVKAFDYQGTAYVSDIIRAIGWCTHHQMDIINMSFGMHHYSKALDEAVREAERSGTVIVASSGNDQKKRAIDYPARFPQVISVGATTKKHTVAPFCNRSKRIDIYAPGDKIYSTWLNGRYQELSGTSMATSHVTGAVALMLAYKPGLRINQIKSLLKRSSSPIGPVSSKTKQTPAAAGELDIAKMMKLLRAPKRRRPRSKTRTAPKKRKRLKDSS